MKSFKDRQNSGFTLMEFLCVIGIIVILATMTIPTFSGKLETSREAVDMANLRSAHAKLVVAQMSNEYAGTTSFSSSSSKKYIGAVYLLTGSNDESKYPIGSYVTAIQMEQKEKGWQSTPDGTFTIGNHSYTLNSLSSTYIYYYLMLKPDGNIRCGFTKK